MDFEISLTEGNLEKMCRACLVKPSNVSLFVAVYDEGESFNLWEVYEKCTNIQIEEDDTLPKAVCDDCLSDLVTVHNFVKKSKSSDAVLKFFIHDEDKKPNRQLLNEMVNDEYYVKNVLSHTSDRMLLDENQIKVEYASSQHTDDLVEEINSSQYNTDENTCDSNIESLEAENDTSTQLCTTKLTANNIISIDGKQFLDTDLLSSDIFEIKHIESESANDTKKHWGEHKNKYHCTICLKPCPSQTRLNEHLRTHTKERPYKCDRCQASFTLVSNLTRHSRVHTGEKPYVCKLCNKGFTQSSSLSTHLRLHAGEKPYLCRCGKSFHPDTSCTSSLRRYSVRDRSKNKVKRRDMCKECGTIYTAVCQTNNHTPCDNDKRFLCSICGKEYASKMGLEHHYRLHTGERPYKCQICEKSFKNTTALKMHHLTHTGERPCICKICGKCFIQPAHLKYHLLIHTGVKEYACPYCSKAFALKGNLTQHLRTHTDETPYECPHCYKGFRTSNSLRKHQKMHESVNGNIDMKVVDRDSKHYIDRL